MAKKDDNSFYLICILLAGLVFGLMAGFVFGWSWDKRTGALSDIRLLEIIAVSGTVGATTLALFFGVRELRRQGKTQRRKELFLQGSIKKELEMSAADLAITLELLISLHKHSGRVSHDCLENMNEAAKRLHCPIINKLGQELIDLPLGHGALAVEFAGQVSYIKERLNEVIERLKLCAPEDMLVQLYVTELIAEICQTGIQACYLRDDAALMSGYNDFFCLHQEKIK